MKAIPSFVLKYLCIFFIFLGIKLILEIASSHFYSICYKWGVLIKRLVLKSFEIRSSIIEKKRKTKLCKLISCWWVLKDVLKYYSCIF